MDFQPYSDIQYKILYTIPIAGFNGLTPKLTLLPAKSIAAKYEEDKIIV